MIVPVFHSMRAMPFRNLEDKHGSPLLTDEIARLINALLVSNHHH
jgi:hypothetical protein